MSRSVPSAPMRRRRSSRWLAALVAVAAAVPTLLAATAGPAAAAGTITLSKSTGLNAAGETITVSGSGYDASKGVYLWFCENTGTRPTGASCDGSTQVWISDSPLAQVTPGSARWGANGTFSVSITVRAIFNDVDCTAVSCGVAVRNDHQSPGTDLDSVTPVSFGTAPEDTTTTTEAQAPEESTTTTTAPASANTTRITLSKATDLGGGEVITVSGTGFVPDQGVYVQFCAAPTGALGTQAGRTTACYPEQDGERTVWLTPVPADGTWSTPLTVSDAFDDVDCRAQSCGVFVRRDHSGGSADFSQDAFAPVTFGDPATTPTTLPGAVGARLTVTPATGIVPGSTITVDGAGFRAGHEIFVGVCDLAVANFAACDFAHVEEVTVDHVARAGGPGTFSAQLVARATFGTTDCSAPASRCGVATWAVSGNDAALEASSPIAFAGAAAPAPAPGGARPGTGAPLARTGASSAQLALLGTLSVLAGAALFAASRRRMA